MSIISRTITFATKITSRNRITVNKGVLKSSRINPTEECFILITQDEELINRIKNGEDLN